MLSFSKKEVPILFTEDFLTTNSPGISIAGTVSVFPVPGTFPPLANFCGEAPLICLDAPLIAAPDAPNVTGARVAA